MEKSLSEWGGLLPAIETQAVSFLNNNPTFDGRGIIVGILDTGVDPNAIGLQVTSEGKPKVIDIIDCSGSGDVKLGDLQAPSDDGTLKSFGGRVIKINPKWNNPTNLYRVGIKNAFELYPKGLISRVKEERKKKTTLEINRLEAELQKLMSTISDNDTSESAEDLRAELAQLRAMEKDFQDPGPLYDCLTFHDGERYQAVIDTSETGDMSNSNTMTDYNYFYQIGRFSDIDALNYGVHIYEEGSILSIVVDAGAHGSHVAGIVSAFHPSQPELNGIAPGCQIVSLKIGDTRLGSMETGVGLTRAIIEAKNKGCHIINLSYGEATTWDNVGHFIRIADEMVNKHGIIFVASAGNNGPALSTVGAPGGTTSSIISVGAYCTKSLMDVAYSMPKLMPETNYTWSSVGPTLDGDIGVSIMAPGGAITSVPTWTLNRNQLMNGTSMSSPNACGCITLLLSAALQSNIPMKPFVVRRAVENSAKIVDNVDILGQGHGLIQVENAWELLKNHNAIDGSDWSDIGYKIDLGSERFVRGIYLKQYVETLTANTFKCTVSPIFHDETSPDVKVKFEVRVKLSCSVSWIEIPEHLLMTEAGKTFSIFVDPTKLSSGVHVGFVKAYDEARPGAGPIFEVPITVVKPELILDGTTNLDIGDLNLVAAERCRRFLVPPKGCTFIDCTITDTRHVKGGSEDEDQLAPGMDSSSRMIVLHALQTFRGTPYRDNEKHSYITLTPGSQHVISWSVHEGVTMELCLARFWSTIGTTSFKVSLQFHGVVPNLSEVVITGGSKVSNLIRVSSLLATSEINPSAKLDKWISPVKPTQSGKISPMGSRDILANGTVLYQLILEYEIDLTENYDVTPRFPGLQGVLYESEFHAQFFMVYDSKKKLIGTGDAWPSSIKCGKGKYVIRLNVRHTSSSVLAGLVDMPMLLERNLQKSIALSFYKTKSDAMIGQNSSRSRAICKGGSVSMYIREPAWDSFPKSVSPGDSLFGTINYEKKNDSLQGVGIKPGGWPIKYIIADTKPSQSNSNGSKSKAVEEVKEEESIDTVVRDSKIKFLKSKIGDKAFMPIYETVSADYSDNLTVKQALLSHFIKSKSVIDKDDEDNDKNEKLLAALTDIINGANSIVTMIDQKAVAMELGVKEDKENPASVTARKDADTKKTALIEAYSAKGVALIEKLRLVVSNSNSNSNSNGNNNDNNNATDLIESEFEMTIKELSKWDDITSDKHWQLYISKLKHRRRWGLALKRVNELINSNADNKAKEIVSRETLLEERGVCLENLGWHHFTRENKKLLSLASKPFYDAF